MKILFLIILLSIFFCTIFIEVFKRLKNLEDSVFTRIRKLELEVFK